MAERNVREAWNELAERRADAALSVLGATVPGDLAERARMLFVLDRSVRAGGDGLPRLPVLDEPTWDKLLELERTGDAAVRRNDASAACEAFDALSELSRKVGDDIGEVNALLGLAEIDRQQDRNAEAEVAQRDALERCEQLGYVFGAARAHLGLGYVISRTRSAVEAQEEFALAFADGESIDDRLGAANALLAIGDSLRGQRDHAGAVERYREAATRFAALESTRGLANAKQLEADALAQLERTDEARAALVEALELSDADGTTIGVLNALDSLADLDRVAGDLDGARASYERILELADAYPLGQGNAHQGLARCAQLEERWDEAARHFSVALERYQTARSFQNQHLALDGLAECAESQGNHDEAVAHRIESVRLIDAHRGGLDRVDAQDEHLRRFRGIYARAVATALRVGRPEAVLYVIEALAGRRLVGLVARERPDDMSGSADDLTFSTQLNVRAADSVAELFGSPRPKPVDERRERVQRALGALAIRSVTDGQVDEGASALLGRSYQPVVDDLHELAGSAPSCAFIAMAERLPTDDDITLVWKVGNGTLSATTVALDEAARVVLDAFEGEDSAVRSSMTSGDLAPLSALIPMPIVTDLDGADGDHEVVIVAVGRLWALPFAALPTANGQPLGALTAITLTPSLTVHARLHARARASGVSTVASWTHPGVPSMGIDALDEAPWTHESLASAGDALDALLAARHDALVIVGHGRPAAGLRHRLELAPGTWVTLADLLDARPPRLVVLLTCWSGRGPVAPDEDALAAATLLLAAGAENVVATGSELASSPQAAEYVAAFLHRLGAPSVAEALHDALAAQLRWFPGLVAEPLPHWAPLITVGAHQGEGMR